MFAFAKPAWFVTTIAFLSATATAHMEMMQPYPIRSKYNPANANSADYSMTAPLKSSGEDFPCKGYQTLPIQVVATYPAGSKQQLKLAGSASHGGGSCQISLSYDGGKTFSVIKSMIGGCPLTTDYDFTVPSYAPNGTALLSWSWQNKVGNREFYQNCAWVDISSSAPAKSRRSNPGKQRRDTFTKWSDLPFMWKANLPPVTSCVTTEGEDPNYAHPGPDVIFADGMSGSSPVAPGTGCDSSGPPGPAYKQIDTGNSANPGPNAGVVSPTAASSTVAASPTSTAGGISIVPVYPSGTSPIASSTISPVLSVPTSTASTPAQTPAHTPVYTPAQTPTHTPVYTPAQTPTHTPVYTPAQTPVQTPAQTPTKSPAQTPVQSPTQTSAQTPAQTPVQTPAYTPVYPPSTGSGSSSGTCTGGALKCLNNGSAFAMCANGQWVNMGSVAAGTVCKNGVITRRRRMTL